MSFVADELRGTEPVGGLGTATTFLALGLARMGHPVEVLHVGRPAARRIDPEWAPVYERAGVRITFLPESNETVEPRSFDRLIETERALRAMEPEVVITQDGNAPVYVALRLRQLGIAYPRTLFVVFCHGTRGWIKDMARNVRVFPHLIGVMTLEEASVELADIVVSPSSYLLDWMRQQGWLLPRRSLVIPYVTESVSTGAPQHEHRADNEGALRRLVFFGRLDERKGVRPFTAAVNALDPELLRRIELEFLGPEIPMTKDRVETLLSATTKRAARAVVFETGLDRREALARLRRPGTLAVMPSLEDNSPNTVYECLDLGIPFLASHMGGTAELIAADDRERALFEPTAHGIEAALRDALCSGQALRPVRAAFNAVESLHAWEELLQSPAPAQPTRAHEVPQVDVVVTDRRPANGVAPCLPALDRQTYPNLNVIVVRSDEHPSPWEARRAGIAAGSAPFLVVLDADDEPDGDFVAALMNARAASEADVVTCGLRLRDARRPHLFPGEPGGLGVIANGYGTPALIRRSVLLTLDRPTAAAGDLDWLLLARAHAAGTPIVSIPVPLLTRADPPASVDRNPSVGLSVVETSEHALAESVRSLARLAGGLAYTQAETTRRPAGMLQRGWDTARRDGTAELGRRVGRRIVGGVRRSRRGR